MVTVRTPGRQPGHRSLDRPADLRERRAARPATIQVPTLVIHRAGATGFPVEHGRYLAAHIPGARYVELPGIDNLIWAGDADAILAEIQAFVTGVRPAPEPQRVLATVLFTDIVDSTRRAAELGDARWHGLLDEHFAVARRSIERYGGREVKTTGDGIVATFDGPARAIRAAAAIRDGVRELGLEIRAGLHTGEIEVQGSDIAGIAVHIAARIVGARGRGRGARVGDGPRPRGRAPASRSRTAGRTSSRACPASGGPSR